MTTPSLTRAEALASIDFDALLGPELRPSEPRPRRATRPLDPDQRAVVDQLLTTDLPVVPPRGSIHPDTAAEITRELQALIPKPPTEDAELVHAAMRATNLTRAALARALGVHYSDVHRWLTGKQRLRATPRRLLRFLIAYPAQAHPLSTLRDPTK